MLKLRKTLILIVVLIILALVPYVILSEKGNGEFPPLPRRRGVRTIPVIFTVDTEFNPDSVEYLIRLFKHYKVKATFFVLGEFGENHETLIKEIDSSENEVACHSYSHPHFFDLNKEEKVKEISICSETIKDITGESVYGFRVPYLEYDDETLLILKDLNFVYDSSMGLIPGEEETPHEILGIKEIPISTFFDSRENLRLIDDYTFYYKLNLTDDEVKELLKDTYEKKKVEPEPMVVLLHPYIISKHRGTLIDFLNYTYADGASFITCRELLKD